MECNVFATKVVNFIEARQSYIYTAEHKSGQIKQREEIKMNHISTENRHHLENTSPLFASVWVALYNSLRENFAENRAESMPGEHEQPASKGHHPTLDSETN